MVLNIPNPLPFYYSDEEGNMPFLPFLVAPISNFQDTLIMGPQNIAKIHDKFINNLYSQIGNSVLPGIAARAFIFESMVCIALHLPTQLPDESGRKGRKISVGFFIKDKKYRFHTNILSTYLYVFLKNFNRQFSLSLPTDGADQLLQFIQSKQDEAWENFVNLQVILDSLLLASVAVGDISKSMQSRFQWPHFRFKSFRKLPKAIFYPEGANQQEVLNIFLMELEKNLTRKGHTSLLECFETQQQSIQLMPLIPFSNLLADAYKVKLKKSAGKSYLTIY